MENILQSNGAQVPLKMPTKSNGIIDTLTDTGSLMDKIKGSKDKFFEIALYGGIGFISGFLLKKYSGFIGICILVLIGLGVLHHFGIITIAISWDKMYEVFGIQGVPNATADNIMVMIWEWIKLNMLISISYAVGFLIGLSLA